MKREPDRGSRKEGREMAMPRLVPAMAIVACGALACGSNGSDRMATADAEAPLPDAAAAPETGSAACTPAVEPWSATEMAALRMLSPLPRTPPADTTNRYSDDLAASRLGQMLFFDKGYS